MITPTKRNPSRVSGTEESRRSKVAVGSLRDENTGEERKILEAGKVLPLHLFTEPTEHVQPHLVC